MAPEILIPITSSAQERAPEPLIYFDTIHATNIHPWEPWYPCGCPYRIDNVHVDDCWLDWITHPGEEQVTAAGGWCAPTEMLSWCGHPLRDGCGCQLELVDTGEVPVIFDVPFTDVELRAANELSDVYGREQLSEVNSNDDDTVMLGVVEPLDEDETTYFERHHDEPTSDVDDDEEESDDGDVRGAAGEDIVDGGDGRS